MNKSLFSGHFLQERLPDLPEWDADPGPVYAALLPLWEKAQRLGSHWNEAQTEAEFIQPVLELLGWSYTVQAKSNRGGQISRPDYALFLDGAAKEEATPFQGQDDAFFGRAAAVGEAKQWQRPLSQSGQGGGAAWKGDRNPSHQMVGYLVGSRVAWGILTNGQEWRLYSREVSSVASEFYTVDLAEIFGAPDTVGADPRVRPQDGQAQRPVPTPEQLDAFKRWWLFFRRDAFVADAQGQNFVERVHSGSATYARQISDKLKEIVFEEVMPAIAGGFVAYRRNETGVQAESEADLRRIYAASLSLLYKLLFLLYGEARSLLPMENAGYRYESLTRMARRFAEWRDQQHPISAATHATREYDQLRALFHRIDRGDPSLAIPRYNGGLFDPHKPDNAFLESHKLSDRAVAEAVDLLVRDRGEPVDYAFIDVRNLGAIYEGLLENRLRVIDAAAGRVELVNDKGERKASGSYYTPDYIVKYIVEQTLEPILDERAVEFAGAMERVVDVRQRLQGPEGQSANRLLQRERERWERAAREAFLGITVCDPAMGSGHFLVNAVDYLTDGIIERMEGWRDAHPQTPQAWNPLYRLIGEVRGQIVEEMAAQQIPMDEQRLDDTALLTRLVMKRCIYGVDLNGMAVELAKLSLWLHSFTVGAPLSFLDHHLRWGNSLIGADVKTVENALNSVEIRRKVSKEAQRMAQLRGEESRPETVAQQSGFFSGPFAGLLDLTEMMLRVAGGADATLADVRRSAAEFADFESNLTPYKRVLDLWVSQYFGNSHALEFIDLYRDEVIPTLRDGRTVSPQYAAAIEQAKELWQAKRFFHWDLEFPEVFVDLERRDWKENPGFDAVIGNPPYLSTALILQTDRGFFRSNYQSSGKEMNTFGLMTEASIKNTMNGGRISFIVPDSFLNVSSYLGLRLLMLERCNLERILQIYGGVFEQAVIGNSVIFIAANEQDNQRRNDNLVQIDMTFGEEHFSLSHRVPQEIYINNPELGFFVDNQLAIYTRLNRLHPALLEYAVVRDGVKTGSNKTFVSRTPSEDQRWKPVLTNSDIDRYLYVFDGQYLLYDRVALARPREEWIFIADEKIIVRQTGDRVIAALDRQQYYSLDNTHLVLPHVKGCSVAYFLALLNSNLLDFLHQCLSGESGRVFAQVRIANLERLPVKQIDFTTPADERAAALAHFHALYGLASPPGPLATRVAGASVGDAFAPLLAFVDEQLPPPAGSRTTHNAPRTDIIHDILAFLAEQMIELNRAKQSEMAGFLAWLEREMGGRVNDLSGKTTIQNYLGDYQKGDSHAALGDLLAVLRKNKRKVTVDPSSRAFQEALQREYAASLGKLLPGKAQLAFTDRLIDQIVYRLYGLTEEEIGIVEGTSSHLTGAQV